MGYQVKTYVGPFLLVSPVKQTCLRAVRRCSAGCGASDGAPSRFCPNCGAAITSATNRVAELSKFWPNSLPDQFIDAFFSPEYVSLGKGAAEDVSVWLPNQGGGRTLEECSPVLCFDVPNAGQEIADSIQAFETRYADALVHLRGIPELAGLKVSWGAVPYAH